MVVITKGGKEGRANLFNACRERCSGGCSWEGGSVDRWDRVGDCIGRIVDDFAGEPIDLDVAGGREIGSSDGDCIPCKRGWLISDG